MSGHLGPWNWRAMGEANEYCLLDSNGKWLISFRINGELLTSQSATHRWMQSFSRPGFWAVFPLAPFCSGGYAVVDDFGTLVQVERMS